MTTKNIINNNTKRASIQWLFLPKKYMKSTEKAFNDAFDLKLLWKEYKRFIHLPAKEKQFVYILESKSMYKARYKTLKKFFNYKKKYSDENAIFLRDKNIFIYFWCDTVEELMSTAKTDVLYIPYTPTLINFYTQVINPISKKRSK